MKYIITEKNGVKQASVGGMYHMDMHEIQMGPVIAAGHCEKNADGTYKVWGKSIGYNILSKPEDAVLLQELLND